MSALYVDTSALLKLYVQESSTDEVHRLVAASRQSVDCHEFHRLESENAMRLKVFRGDIGPRQAEAALTQMRQDLRAGRLRRRSVEWEAAFVDARRLAQSHTRATGCRSLDLLHIAIACQWECAAFLTLDDRQARAAAAAGLSLAKLPAASA